MKTSQIDYSKALTWYLNDKKLWPTVLTLSLYILSCFLVLPVLYVGPLLIGYTMSIIRNVQNGIYEIPEISGDQWKDGIVFLLLSFAAVMVIGFVAGVLFLTLGILSEVLRETAPVTSGILSACVALITIGIQFVASLLAPVISMYFYAIYAKTKSVSSLLQWSNYVEITQRNGATLLIGALLYTVATSVLVSVGMFACCIGVLPATVISYFIMAGVIGQLDVTKVS